MRGGVLQSTWEYERTVLPPIKAPKLLVKVLMSKIKKARGEFENSVESIPLVQDIGPNLMTINRSTYLIYPGNRTQNGRAELG